MFKLPFLAFVIAIVASSSVITCDVCDDDSNPPSSKVVAAGTAPHSTPGTIPQG